MFVKALLAALVCGFLSGLGVGGGSLLIVCLTALFSFEPETARGINLLYFLPTALAALLLHQKNRLIDWQSVLPAILGGLLLAALGAFLASHLPTELLRRLFGGFLLAVGAAELFRRDQNAR